MNKITAAEEMLRIIKTFNESEQETFSEIVNKLLQENFIVDVNSDNPDYFFISNNVDIFQAYFAIASIQFEIDRIYKVAYIKNNTKYNTLRLKKYETIVLLALRQLFYKKTSQLTLSRETTVKYEELSSFLIALGFLLQSSNYKHSDVLDALRLLRRYNLVKFLSKDLNKDTIITILPSIIHAVNNTDVDILASYLEAHRNVIGGDEDEEESDED